MSSHQNKRVEKDASTGGNLLLIVFVVLVVLGLLSIFIFKS